MQMIKLYRFIRPEGGVTVTAEKPEADYTELVRLIADEGKALTDGNTLTPCVDTDDPTIWAEVEAPEEWKNPFINNYTIEEE